MVKNMYSVYDVKTGVYGTVMVLLSDGEAIRIMQDTVNANDNMIAKHPNDFRLDCIGEFNLCTGEINTVKTPRHVIDVAQLVAVENKGA